MIIPLTDGHRTLLAALNPLRAVQRNLELRLGAGASEDDGTPSSSGQRTPIEGYDASGRALGGASNLRASGVDPASGSGASVSFRDITNAQGGGAGLAGASARHSDAGDGQAPAASLSRGLSARRRRSQEFFVHAGGWKSAVLQRLGRRPSGDKENAGVDTEEKNGIERDAKTIAGLRTQMRVLWGDRSVREVLKLRGMRLFDSAE